MAERLDDICPFSGAAVLIDDYSVPIECPECGSVRKVPQVDRPYTESRIAPAYRASFAALVDSYPKHSRLLRIQIRHSHRKRWQRVNGVWCIVGRS